MKNKKLKEPHLSAEIEIILFEFSDIVTASGDWTAKPDLGNTDQDGWT